VSDDGLAPLLVGLGCAALFLLLGRAVRYVVAGE